MKTHIAFRLIARRVLEGRIEPDEQLSVYESLAALAEAGACPEEERYAAHVVAALRYADRAQVRFAALVRGERV